MGKWNRRYLYLPRKSYREYEYEDPPLSPPRTCDDPSNSAEVADSGVPVWEINYCKSVRISWNKVLASKKYIYAHPSVLNWDDSSGKEAFENAKQRYWAMINGFPCENPLPDPNMYIEEINGYAYVNPEMMEDLDRQFFNPDIDENVGRLETINEEVPDNKDKHTILNLWEANNNVQGQDAVQGWGEWGDSVNLQTNNPWEQSSNQQPLDSWKTSAWKSGYESRGWNEGRNNNYTGSSCNYGSSQNVAGRQEGWGGKEMTTSYWSEKNGRGKNSRNFGNCRNTWKNNNSTWTGNGNGNGNGSGGWRELGFQVYESNGFDSGKFNRSGNSFHGGGRKRESSVQYPSKYKISRYQGYNNHGDSWQV